MSIANSRVGYMLGGIVMGAISQILALIALVPSWAAAADGVEIVRGNTTLVPIGARDTQAFRYRDGRVAVDAGDLHSYWSADGGKTWVLGPKGAANYEMKSAIDLGSGEILSLKMGSTSVGGGWYRTTNLRSQDYWQSRANELSYAYTPQAVPMTNDSGVLSPGTGLRFHHGLIELPNGDLMATMYGTYAEDKEIVQSGASSCGSEFARAGFRKFRTVAVFSSDGGRTWDRPQTIASYHMVRPSSQVTEGFSEADAVIAANGDIVVVMRTGGMNLNCPGYRGSPLYVSRSKDLGKSWSVPTPIADTNVGSNPNLVALEDGTIALTYSRPGAYLMFSDDNGLTWKNKIKISEVDAYSDIVQIASDKILATHFVKVDGKNRVASTIFKARKEVGVTFNVKASQVAKGQVTHLVWSGKNVEDCRLSGGKFAQNSPVPESDPARSTGTLTVSTTYTLRCRSKVNPAEIFQRVETVNVN